MNSYESKSFATGGTSDSTATGQSAWLVGENATSTFMSGIDKGGMRGIGLVAVMLAEIALKKKGIDLAQDYYTTNKRDYDFFKALHKAPTQATAAEAFSATANPTYSYDLYASAPAGMAISAAIDRKWYETRRRVHRYAVGLQQRIDYDFSILRAHAVAAGWNAGRRYELAWTDTHNERAFNRKIAVANIGINVGNQVRQTMATAIGNMTQAYDNIGDTVASIGNGWAASRGYNAAREATSRTYNPENDDGA